LSLIKEKINGTEGIVASISFDLSGCCQALLDLGVDKDKKRIDNYWMDICRIEVLDDEPVMEQPDFCDIHGPADKPTV
jgi:hypothetical protein